ncbi:MAG TPA: hypothetical protein EYH26_03340 [Pyrodictium sp.]|nr:hypothetical protein [Pyrodictium sp.]
MGTDLKLSATMLATTIIALLMSACLALSQYVEISTESPPLHLETITLSAGQELYLKICGPPGAPATFHLYDLSTGNIIYNVSFSIGLTGYTILRLKAPDKSGTYIALFNIEGLTYMLLLKVEPSLPSPTITTITSTTTVTRQITVTKTVAITKTVTTTTTLKLSIVQPLTVYVTEYTVSPLAPKIAFTKVYGVTTTIFTTTTVYETSTITVTVPIYETVYKVIKGKIPITKTDYKTVKVTETKVVKKTVPKPIIVKEYLVDVSSLVAAFALGAAIGAAITLVYTRR